MFINIIVIIIITSIADIFIFKLNLKVADNYSVSSRLSQKVAMSYSIWASDHVKLPLATFWLYPFSPTFPFYEEN